MKSESQLQANPYDNLYGRELAFDELADIRSNIVGFFMELVEADEENKARETNNLMKGTNE